MTREMRAPLLVPLDGSLPGAEVLTAAEAVADLVDAELDVLSVSEQPLTPDEVALCARVPADWLPRVRLHTAGGDPGQAIVRCARDLNARAILLSSHGATGNLGEPAGHVTLTSFAIRPVRCTSCCRRCRCTRSNAGSAICVGS